MERRGLPCASTRTLTLPPTVPVIGNPQTLVEDIVHMQEAQSTVSFTSAHHMDGAGMNERVTE